MKQIGAQYRPPFQQVIRVSYLILMSVEKATDALYAKATQVMLLTMALRKSRYFHALFNCLVRQH